MTDVAPEPVDPYQQDWDDDEMMAKQADYARLLTDAGLAWGEDLTALGDMTTEEQGFIASSEHVTDDTTGMEMPSVEGSRNGMDPTPDEPLPEDAPVIQTDISTDEFGSSPEGEV